MILIRYNLPGAAPHWTRMAKETKFARLWKKEGIHDTG